MKRKIAIALACVLSLANLTTAMASEGKVVVAESVETVESSEVEARGYKEFASKQGNFSAQYGLRFNVDRSCNLKFTCAAKYTDGSSGTLKVTLNEHGFLQTYSVPMDGATHTITFKPAVPIGTYEIVATPDNGVKSFIIVGTAYSTDY